MPIHPAEELAVPTAVVQPERPDPGTSDAVVTTDDVVRGAPLTRRSGRSREAALFLIGIALVALHVLDDNYVQPEAGMSPGDHIVSGLVPLALLGLAAWAYPRLRGGRRGALALVFGVLGIAAGSEALFYTREVGPSGDDFTGLLAIPAGLMLIGLGAVTLWRTRRTDGNLPSRYGRRALLAIAGFVVATLVGMVVLGYGTTHIGHPVVPPDRLGVSHENVTFTTGDGLKLEGWYIPSRNGAAVIAFPGRRGSQRKARMLARHGYGVLLFDRRGEGRQRRRPQLLGLGRPRPTSRPPITYLQHRPDVDPDRIGGIGLSVGGEMMIEAAAETDELARGRVRGRRQRARPARILDSDDPGPGEVDARPRDVCGQDRRGRRSSPTRHRPRT